MRAQTNTRSRARHESGSSTYQAAPRSRNSPNAYRQRIANPPHPTATAAENTAPRPTYMSEVQGEGEPQSCDDCDAIFHERPASLTQRIAR